MGTIHVIDNNILQQSELHLVTVAGRQFKYRGGWRIAPGDWMNANTSKADVREHASKGEWTGSSGRLAIIGFESAEVHALSKRVAVGTLQYNEMLGLAESGVTAINLTLTATQVTQGKSTFTKTVSSVDANGNPVTTSTEQTVQNVNFTTNNFYREFSDNPVVTEAATAFPQMQGAGLVRDLWEAMSLGLRAQGEKTGNCQRKRAKVRQRSRRKFSVRNTPIVPKLGCIGSEKHFPEKVQAL